MSFRNLVPLEQLLGEISRRCFAVSWYPEIPWYGWYFTDRGPQGAGRGQVTPADVEVLRMCREDLDQGWLLYPLGRPAYVDAHRWLMAFGGGPPKVIEETRRLERKLQLAVDAQDDDRVHGLLQGTIRWW